MADWFVTWDPEAPGKCLLACVRHAEIKELGPVNGGTFTALSHLFTIAELYDVAHTPEGKFVFLPNRGRATGGGHS